MLLSVVTDLRIDVVLQKVVAVVCLHSMSWLGVGLTHLLLPLT